jgi:hypothetical protein
VDAAQFNFQLLYDAFRNNHDTYVRGVWSTITAVLVAIGWLLTSETTREFLRKSDPSRRLALFGIMVAGIIHLLVLAQVWDVSARLTTLLASDPYVVQQRLAPEYYRQFTVPTRYVVVSGLLDGTLFVVLGGLVHACGRKPRRARATDSA